MSEVAESSETTEAAEPDVRDDATRQEDVPAGAARTLKGLSLWQPWASLIAWGEKTIETRSWSTNYRGPVAILSTKELKAEARELADDSIAIGKVLNDRAIVLDDLPLGCVVAVADLVEVFQFEEDYDPGVPERHFGDYTPGRYGFKLENVRELTTPIACTGGRGIFDLPETFAEQVWNMVELNTTIFPPPAEESAPGPEAAAGAADADCPPPPIVEEPVGSANASDVPDADLWHMIRDAREEERDAESEVAELQEDLKGAKKRLEAASLRLGKLIDDAKYPSLFSGKKAAPSPTLSEIAAATKMPSAPPEKPLALEWVEIEDEGVCASSRYSPAQDDIGLNTYYIDAVRKEDGDWDHFALWLDDIAPVLPPEVLTGTLIFETLDAAKARCQEIENAFWSKAHGLPDQTPTPAEDDAWRAVRLDGLTPAIPDAKMRYLTEAGIETIGQLEEFQEKHGEWWAKEINRFGETGERALCAALDAYWHANPRLPKPLATGLNRVRAGNLSYLRFADETFGVLDVNGKLIGSPPAELLEQARVTFVSASEQSVIDAATKVEEATEAAANATAADDFAEDTIVEGTLRPVCDVEKHLRIEAVQYSNGQWRATYWIGVGTLDKSRKLEDSPGRPTMQAAGQEAIDTVRELLKEVRPTLKGKADQKALEITWSLDSGEKNIATGDAKPRGKKKADAEMATA